MLNPLAATPDCLTQRVKSPPHDCRASTIERLEIFFIDFGVTWQHH
jgi:hypothetical protein